VNTIDLVNQNTLAQNATREPSNELAGDDFLNLFITQLKFQDPTSPMDTNQMLAQVTQLATMEGLTNIQNQQAEAFSLSMLSAASDTVGKTVTYFKDEKTEVTAKVLSTTVNNGAAPVLTLDNGEQVPLDAVASIRQASTDEAPANPSDETPTATPHED